MTDDKSKKVPEEIPGRTLLKNKITPDRAMAEFKVAIDIWFGYMDYQTMVQALQAVQDRMSKAQ